MRTQTLLHYYDYNYYCFILLLSYLRLLVCIILSCLIKRAQIFRIKPNKKNVYKPLRYRTVSIDVDQKNKQLIPCAHPYLPIIYYY